MIIEKIRKKLINQKIIEVILTPDNEVRVYLENEINFIINETESKRLSL